MKKLLLSLLLFCGLQGLGQSNLTLYHMKSLPQSMYANPANSPDSKLFIGIPALSSIHLNTSAIGVNFDKADDLFVLDPATDSFTFNVNNVVNLFEDPTSFQFRLDQDWIHFGFRLDKHYFTFNCTEKVKAQLDVPKDFFKLISEGNGGSNLDNQFKLDFSVDYLRYREYAVGYNIGLLEDEKLKVGARLKYLQGFNVLNTAKNDLTLLTRSSDFTILAKADLEFNTARTNSIDAFISDTNNSASFPVFPQNSRNNGWGLDLGVSYDYNDKLTLSGSLIDLGSITWKDNAQNVKSKNPGATFEFRGLDKFAEFFQDSVDFSESFENLGDSILDVFALDTSENSFKTGLISEFYIGANYQLFKKLGVSGLLYGSFYNRTFYPAFTIAANAKIHNALSMSMSYSAKRKNLANLGLGLSVNLGAFQYYFVTDNMLGVITGNYNNLGFRTGFMLTFKRDESEKQTPTQPVE